MPYPYHPKERNKKKHNFHCMNCHVLSYNLDIDVLDVLDECVFNRNLKKK